MITSLSAEDKSGDAFLLAAWRRGDMRAARTLYRRHFQTVCRFFRNKLSSLDEVADLVGDTFLELLKTRSRPSWEDERVESLRYYLLGIARNVLYGHLRRKLQDGQKVPLSDDELEQRSLADLAPRTMSSIIGGRRELDSLIEALRGLPLGDQILLEAKYFEYLADADLAGMLEIPISTLPGRLRGARTRLIAGVNHLYAGASSRGCESPALAMDTWIAELRTLIARTNPTLDGEPTEP